MSWKSTREGAADTANDLGVYPYPGLRSFRPNEADLFFGRDSQIEELRNLLADHNIIVVLGGSGSGKSSLVRAGLVPKLNSTSPIPERSGAWYVVEFRPKLDPVNELFDAIFNQIILPALTVPPPADNDGTSDGSLSIDFAKERARRISAINSAFDLTCEPDAPNESIQWQCRTRLRNVLFEGDVIDVGALFDFVDERLRTLDEALSDGASSGAPNLLLLIDQFEEVFKPKVDAAGSRMIMSLITSIHTYRPFNLFLIITMRSEELHRCSEFLGVTEVVNSSMYLVDLIGGRDIEQAIVEPARRVLKSWDLDPGDPETGPYTRRALSQLHQVFDDGREVLPHPADQLPLMQNLLPLVWDKAIERWEAKSDETPLQIDLEDFEALPGWRSPEGPLIGTLNEGANDVLRRAIAAGARVGGGELSEEAVGRLLRAAFCCLAQLDDRGNVVRDFATLEQMLMSSGVYERQPERQDACKVALRTALGVFQRATLINVGTNYDVNHEAFIRGWKTYADWLKDVRRQQERLVNVDRMIADRVPEQRSSAAKERWAIRDYLSIERFARADQIAGAETRTDLQDLLGSNGVFSDQWARRTLERADATSPHPAHGARTLTQRLNAIRQTLDDAIRYPRAKNLQFNIFVILAAGAILLSVLVPVLMRENIEQKAITATLQDLTKQFRFFGLQNEATSRPQGDRPRSPTNDRELYVALMRGLEHAKIQGEKKSNGDEALTVLRAALRELDKGARDVLSDVSVIPGIGAATGPGDLRTARCAIADPAQDDKNLIGSKPWGLGLALRAQEAGGVNSVAMFPISNDGDGRPVPIKSSNFAGGTPLLAGALVCLSDNANWLLMWPSQRDSRQAGWMPPYIQRIAWVRLGPITDQDDMWHAALGPPRRPNTTQSWDVLESSLNEQYSALYDDVRQGRPAFQSFQSGDRVGFLITVGQTSDFTALLWTTTGLLDPDPVESALPHPLSECQFVRDPKSDQQGKTVMRCGMGSIGFDGLEHELFAHYRIDDTPQLASAEAQGAAPCYPESALCRTELRVEYVPRQPERDPVRIAVEHLSSTVKAAAIWDGYLWVRDANGQVWRYLVGLDKIMTIVPERWKATPPVRLGEHSEACTLAKCDTEKVPDWPASPQESVK